MIEVDRLSGTEFEPRWVSIEDNSAGYDIGSWRFSERGDAPTPKFIEVKFSSSLQRFFFSRQEWSFAERHPDSWELQFWMSDAPAPRLFNVDDLRHHVAINQGYGQWETMMIEVDHL